MKFLPPVQFVADPVHIAYMINVYSELQRWCHYNMVHWLKIGEINQAIACQHRSALYFRRRAELMGINDEY